LINLTLADIIIITDSIINEIDVYFPTFIYSSVMLHVFVKYAVLGDVLCPDCKRKKVVKDHDVEKHNNIDINKSKIFSIY